MDFTNNISYQRFCILSEGEYKCKGYDFMTKKLFIEAGKIKKEGNDISLLEPKEPPHYGSGFI